MSVLHPPEYYYKKPNVFFIVTSLFFIFHTYIFAKSADWFNESYWLILLFALPPILQLIGLVVLHRKLRHDPAVWNFFWFYLFCMPVCLCGYLVVWEIYQRREDLIVRGAWGDWLAIIPLLLIFLLMFPSWMMTYRLMETPGDEFGDEQEANNSYDIPTRFSNSAKYGFLLFGMKKSISRVPSWAFLLFFTMFLVNVYLFSFAFALHDVRETNSNSNNPDKFPALYLPEIYNSDADRKSEAADNETKPDPSGESQNHNLQRLLGNNKTTDTDPLRYKFYFDVCSTHLIYVEQVKSVLTSKTGGQGQISNEEVRLQYRRNHNFQRIAELIRDIKIRTAGGNRTRLELYGRADETPAGNCHYPSNYALSEARAYSVVAEIDHRLYDNIWRSIEWRIIASSSEPPNNQNDGSTIVDMELLKRSLDRLPLAITEKLKPIDEVKKIVAPNQNSQKQWKITDEGRILIKELVIKLESLDNILKQPQSKDETKIDELKNLIGRYNEQIEDAGIASGSSQQRVVEVTLTGFKEPFHHQSLKLFDYVVYAITGPDYGDVFPRTPYAKFLCVFAVIIQIFYMVALFNAITSLKKNNKIKPNLPPGNDGKNNMSGQTAHSQSPSPSPASPPPPEPDQTATDTDRPSSGRMAVDPKADRTKEVEAGAIGAKSAGGPAPDVEPASSPTESSQGQSAIHNPEPTPPSKSSEAVEVGSAKADSGDVKPQERLTSQVESPPLLSSPAKPSPITLESYSACHLAVEESGRVRVEAPADIKLEPKSNQDWITIKGVVAPNLVVYSVSKNPNETERTGEIDINGAKFTVSQEGAEKLSEDSSSSTWEAWSFSWRREPPALL